MLDFLDFPTGGGCEMTIVSDNGNKENARKKVEEAWIEFRDSDRGSEAAEMRNDVILAVADILNDDELSAIRDKIMKLAPIREKPRGARPVGVRR